jgi:hypothetical protein
MNAITQTDPGAEFTFDHAAFHELEPGVPDSARYNGWTAEKQKRFLTALSLGHPINRACDIVGMSRQSAYALRNAARGAAFRHATRATPRVSPAAHARRPAGSRPPAAARRRTPASAIAR